MRLRTRVLLLGALACYAPAPPDPRIHAVDPFSADSVLKVDQVESPPMALSCPQPNYPPAARAPGVQGRVVVQVIIDTLGRPEPKTISILESPSLYLSLSVRSAVRGCVFRPAQIHGHAVRVVLRMPYDFAIR